MTELSSLKPIQKFIKAVGQGVKGYFGGGKGCIICLGDDGIFYGEGIYEWLNKQGAHVDIAFMKANGAGLEEARIKGRKVLIVDNDIVSGASYKRILEYLRQKKEKLKIKDIKFAVLCDRTGLADYTAEGYLSFTPLSLKEIDGLDLKIIKELMRDGRVSFVEIAEETGLTPAGIKKRFEKLIKERVIKIQGVFNLDKFYNFSCQIKIDADEKIISYLIERFQKNPFVYHLVRTLGRYNLMVSIAAPNFESIESFIEKEVRKISDIKDIEVSMGELPITPRTFVPKIF